VFRAVRVVGSYFNMINSALLNHPLLSPEEERDLTIRFYKTRDPKVLQRLVTSNLRYVARQAYKYGNDPQQIKDLFQEGTIGLIKGIELFDPFQNNRLLTYAGYCIRTSMLKFLNRDKKFTDLDPNLSVGPIVYDIENKHKEHVFNQLCDQFALTLNERDRQIFRDRLRQNVPIPLRTVARKHKITFQRVEQLEKRFKKLFREYIKTHPQPDVVRYLNEASL
jgi:RNA polymerase sigma factor (sigma-70 family)